MFCIYLFFALFSDDGLAANAPGGVDDGLSGGNSGEAPRLTPHIGSEDRHPPSGGKEEEVTGKRGYFPVYNPAGPVKVLVIASYGM